MLALLIPTADQLEAGTKAFFDKEPRSQTYFKALNHIKNNWSKADKMAFGAKILLDSWHINFYRFGRFSLSALSDCIARNFEAIEAYKNRNIISFSDTDEDTISLLFKDFLEALKGGKNNDIAVPSQYQRQYIF